MQSPEFLRYMRGEGPDDEPTPIRPLDRTPYYLHVYNGDGLYMGSDVYHGVTEKGVTMRALVMRLGVRYITAQTTRATTMLINGKQWDVTECEFIGTNKAGRAFVGLSGMDASHIERPPRLTVVGGRVSSY